MIRRLCIPCTVCSRCPQSAMIWVGSCKYLSHGNRHQSCTQLCTSLARLRWRDFSRILSPHFRSTALREGSAPLKATCPDAWKARWNAGSKYEQRYGAVETVEPGSASFATVSQCSHHSIKECGGMRLIPCGWYFQLCSFGGGYHRDSIPIFLEELNSASTK